MLVGKLRSTLSRDTEGQENTRDLGLRRKSDLMGLMTVCKLGNDCQLLTAIEVEGEN